MNAPRRAFPLRGLSRSTLILGIVAAGAVAAAVIVTVWGGPRSTQKHDSVVLYIKDVNALERRMRRPLTSALDAYRSFAGKGTSDAAVAGDLGRAEQTLQTLRRQLVALPAPPAAAQLRGLLVDLANSEVAIAREVRGLAVFNPRFTALVARSSAVGKKLDTSLKAVKAVKPHRIRGTKAQVAKAQAAFNAASDRAAAQQADAVDAYRAALGGVLAQMRRLRPPAVMAPLYRAQVQALSESRRAGAALATELRRKPRPNVAVLARRFALAARSAGSVAAQRKQIVAVKAYNARVRAVDGFQKRIRDELGRLTQLDG